MKYTVLSFPIVENSKRITVCSIFFEELNMTLFERETKEDWESNERVKKFNPELHQHVLDNWEEYQKVFVNFHIKEML